MTTVINLMRYASNLILNCRVDQVVLARDDSDALKVAKGKVWDAFLLDRQLRAAQGTAK
jgi:hypothetical protein